MFGERTFTGFVSGDHLPALGLNGGTGRVLLANRTWDNTPETDISAGMWVTEGGAGATVSSRLIGSAGLSPETLLLQSTQTRCRTSTLSAHGTTYDTGSFPRSAFLSRHLSASYSVHNGTATTHSDSTEAAGADATVSFFATQTNTTHSPVRGGLAFYGRSINLEAMNTACVALSGAITWPT